MPSELSDFQPVPVRTHEGWTPARQKAFIEILGETASVKRAAAAVNMSTVSCYYLKRHPQGADFARAWQAALDFGVSRLKDIAFERAVEGRLDPVWQGGKLVGHKRVYSDGMLMFLLRQYGSDASGRNVTVNYVRTKAAVAARSSDGEAQAGAEAETTTMTVRAQKPSIKDGKRQDDAALLLSNFSGCELDQIARAEIASTLAACAARQREVGGGYDDTDVQSYSAGPNAPLWLGSFEPPHGWVQDVEPFDPDEPSWQSIGDTRYIAQSAADADAVE